MLAVQLLGSMKISVKYPIMESVNAIFITSNITTTWHTKHVDIWYKYVNEHVEDGVVKTISVPSADNDSNILTKI